MMTMTSPLDDSQFGTLETVDYEFGPFSLLLGALFIFQLFLSLFLL